jgi:iron complex transport system permease protein
MSGLVERRALVYCALTATVLVAVALATLTLGKLGIPIAELPSALFGGADATTTFVLERLRGPRLVTAILAGALLGVSGALFQTVTRNPLGSPDVIGLGAGAGAGVAITALAFPLVPSSIGAVLGAGAATALVFVSTGRGFRSPNRTIIAGIAVAALAYAVTQYVVSTQLRDAASQLAAYLVGSLNAANGQDVLVTAIAAVAVLPLAAALSRDVSLLEMGDDAASGVGVDPHRTRTLAVVLSVLAAGASVAATGPVSFVALTAPQIARRLIGTSGASILPSACTGALILALADLAAQQAPVVAGLPVGVLTLGVGGLYLGYLLVREHAKGRL